MILGDGIRELHREFGRVGAGGDPDRQDKGDCQNRSSSFHVYSSFFLSESAAPDEVPRRFPYDEYALSHPLEPGRVRRAGTGSPPFPPAVRGKG